MGSIRVKRGLFQNLPNTGMLQGEIMGTLDRGTFHLATSETTSLPVVPAIDALQTATNIEPSSDFILLHDSSESSGQKEKKVLIADLFDELLLPQGPIGPVGPPGQDGSPGVGVPTGGAPGQVLVKNSADDYDTSWIALTGVAPLASPTFTGTPAAPTATAGTNTTQLATTAFVGTAVTNERTATATLTNKTLTSPTINGGTANPTTLTENASPVVVQTDIGTAPNEIPLNGMLGGLAFQSPESLVVRPAASVTPHQPGSMVFELTNNTTLTVKVRGSDGTVRSATLTLT